MAKNRDNPVVLSRIYTRTGDDGTTALGDASRTRKTDPRLAAYADVEEANAAIGAAIALGTLPGDVVTLLTRVQNDLFDVGADLCAPVVPDPQYPPLRVEPSYIERLEAACDEHNETLEPLRSFILPGGTPGAALLHVARTVTRRAERTAWAAVEAHGAAADGDPEAVEGGVNPLTAKYLNRLSDLLFILCRVANAEHGDVLWKPGGER
ncbi:cob(I)yrinic acid a,c-diamide adenosyltransferase [Actinomadura sp. GC306]|uniref:cob(I)yrinic acid a,c-diamide adenosyltransferase n=1 Tax=Actinomadura sp. GC306 TaxID=2530367 RepID=UPI00105180C8|nr:cob(I)yrinic acid a,c-diamide adenosyltransferase [Actinomadura sp. GC306]TDC59648.1 cob(I)yrinic acid a,c-diamide adenosyltransferase [Actinomadura sp. GC306]